MKNRLPTVCEASEFARDGCLIAFGPDHNGALVSYAVDHVALARRAGALADRILRGALPAEIPIEQATKFELVLNLKTAKKLGLMIPPSLLLRAD